MKNVLLNSKKHTHKHLWYDEFLNLDEHPRNSGMHVNTSLNISKLTKVKIQKPFIWILYI